MESSVTFNKISQNSILICKISLSPLNIPDCLYIHIEAHVYTPIIKEKILTSLPIFYEPINLEFYYKCVIPYNAVPTFESEHYKVHYKLVMTFVSGKSIKLKNYTFKVLNNHYFINYKYNIFLDSDMLRIDLDENDNTTGFKEIVNFLRTTKISTNEKTLVNKIKEKINKINTFNENFKEILKKHKSKGDVYYYLRKQKNSFCKYKESSITQNGILVILFKYTYIVKNKIILKIDFFKNFNLLKIFLIRNLQGEISETLLKVINVQHTIYKKINIKKDWEDYSLRTIYFESKLYLKILIDDLCFNIFPLFT